jgi:hypothetical protein
MITQSLINLWISTLAGYRLDDRFSIPSTDRQLLGLTQPPAGDVPRPFTSTGSYVIMVWCWRTGATCAFPNLLLQKKSWIGRMHSLWCTDWHTYRMKGWLVYADTASLGRRERRPYPIPAAAVCSTPLYFYWYKIVPCACNILAVE